MSPNVVEEKSDFIQSILQVGGAVNVELLDHRFDATKEARNSSVEPWGRKLEWSVYELRPDSEMFKTLTNCVQTRDLWSMAPKTVR